MLPEPSRGKPHFPNACFPQLPSHVQCIHCNFLHSVNEHDLRFNLGETTMILLADFKDRVFVRVIIGHETMFAWKKVSYTGRIEQ